MPFPKRIGALAYYTQVHPAGKFHAGELAKAFDEQQHSVLQSEIYNLNFIGHCLTSAGYVKAGHPQLSALKFRPLSVDDLLRAVSWRKR